MTIQDILNNSRIGDTVCGKVLTQEDIVLFEIINNALYRAHTIRGLKWTLRNNKAAITWIDCLTQGTKK